MFERNGHQYFAIRLTRITSLRAMGWDPGSYPDDPARAHAIRESSRARHGRPVAEVEAEIPRSIAGGA